MAGSSPHPGWPLDPIARLPRASGATGIGKLENGSRPEAISEIARLRRSLPEPDPENRAAISIRSARPPIITVMSGLAAPDHHPSPALAAEVIVGGWPFPLDCQPEPAEMAERCGPEATVSDWSKRLVCVGCTVPIGMLTPSRSSSTTVARGELEPARQVFAILIEGIWFAQDSPLEGDGFELPVPRQRRDTPHRPRGEAASHRSRLPLRRDPPLGRP